MSRARCDGNYDDNRLTFKLVMVRGTDDPDDGPGHQVHPPRVGKLHQLPGHRHEAATQILLVLTPIAVQCLISLKYNIKRIKPSEF